MGFGKVNNKITQNPVRSQENRKIKIFTRRLLGWYRAHGRHDLPWRGAFDPYHVLVSEFMLQQTTVSTVIPYFHRFMKAFPTIQHLARAPLEKVLNQWAGLGYYARARNLHRSAQAIVRHHDGMIPSERSQAEDLPGVGPYTAGALLSFAHDRPEALVDGNVIRVLSRIFGVKGDTRRPAVLSKIWAVARTLMPIKGARHYNSAIMDFGATLCKPGLPDCPVCPMREICWANQNGWVDRLPQARPDAPKLLIKLTAYLIEKDGRVALQRRPLGGLWGGLWELPTAEEKGGAVGKPMRQIKPLKRLGTVRHILSHRDLRVEVWQAQLEGTPKGIAWRARNQVRAMAISTLTKKLLQFGTP